MKARMSAARVDGSAFVSAVRGPRVMSRPTDQLVVSGIIAPGKWQPDNW
jgi:hypothetical protein